MEKYLYPTIKLMQHLQEKGGNDLPGGIQTMAMYSFYLQGQLYPKQRAQEDLEVLKAATLTSDDELCNQVRSETQQVDNAHTQMRNILYKTCKKQSLSLSMTNFSSKAPTSYTNAKKKLTGW